MKTELTILNQMKCVIESQLNDYLDSDISSISDRNVQIEFPDIDQMPMSTMIYIQPNWEDFENLSTESDISDFNVSVFIICKKDRAENLIRKIDGYFTAFYYLIRTNNSLDGVCDFSQIKNADFYPAVEGNRNVQAVEVSVSIRYTKDF